MACSRAARGRRRVGVRRAGHSRGLVRGPAAGAARVSGSESVKYVIVNADDFGASGGTNRGIVDAHINGIVTSTSLLVHRPWSADAATLATRVPDLSVGLHLDLDRIPEADLAAELERQYIRFEQLMGYPPTHSDVHHHAHRDARFLPHVLRFAQTRDLPLRGHSTVRACSKFYGQWGGATHLEQIGLDGFERILATEVRDAVTELSCHPGYVDAELRSSYSVEREVELRTLCDPAARSILSALGLSLISFRDLNGHGTCVAAEERLS
ncbi:MAG: ChbG/HpnK family deacetylase [Gemmatimonadales bacterium]